MPIDSCLLSFSQLSAEVLPHFMKMLRKGMAAPRPMAEFATAGVGVRAILNRLNSEKDFAGCYVQIDSGKPIYVGISKKVVDRLRQHVLGTTHYAASLAYRIG